MSIKNTLTNFRIEVNALLKRRSRFVDPRSYNGFERNVFKQQRKNLENLKLVLKGIKKLNVVLTKKNFNEILNKLNQTYKVTIYGNFSVSFKKSGKLERSREALETFEFKGDDDKKLMIEIKRRQRELMINHFQTDDYYNNNIRKLESLKLMIHALTLERKNGSSRTIAIIGGYER